MFTGPEMVKPEFFGQHAESEKILVNLLNGTTPWWRVAEHQQCAKFHTLPSFGAYRGSSVSAPIFALGGAEMPLCFQFPSPTLTRTGTFFFVFFFVSP